ncbi:RagB/SusD family nutrient uptake outer membrane protein [Sinomicrobium weinanense]|uniref:RagB/SusD family nutrient uptake outer membrane protein n=1 Tax=Sinomicrobium weinanense TaxID=2842200 RepID=A0A926JPG1_9FLAO|nr:RagB/SusD family nutrient uptake outer membrane protein [Sinomicrobium weinanense]MBC9794959.1 RagB/SusD family nutrient uptake outer membrane protein [Sinomicrobium weinanense]MBU3125180.1 RagB/SusD family nutrient uptake outer membrane protein [Sinomicrobium weinanense]
MRYLYIFLALTILGSCESELELTAPSELTASGFWDSENGARAAHSGLYGSLRDLNSTMWLLGEIRSDVWGGQTFESPDNLNLIESNITVSTAPFGGWAGIYTRIHQLNDFLLNVPDITFGNIAEKNHMLGQAYGLRALYYYTLLKTWGGVPITTEPLATTNPEGLSKPRSSEGDVMAQIKSDITASLDAFGGDSSFWQGKRIYWSKAATLALKGEVYIWSGTLLNGGEADYTVAKNALLQIQDMDVQLEPDYGELWSTDNENNREFIFALQYEQDQATNFYSSFTGRTTEIQPQYDDKGNSMNDFIVNGANRYGPSEKTLLLTDDTLDTRKDATFIRLYKDDNGGAGYPVYDGAQYFGAVIRKFGGSIDGSIRISDNDVPLYRYADVLLLLAEVKNRLGEDPSAEINQVRKRAYAGNYDAAIHAYVNGSEEDNTKAILDERYKEFIAEGKRWWDLRRAGDKYVTDNVQFLSPGEEYKLLLPITLDMIGRNPMLEQTPGYE